MASRADDDSEQNARLYDRYGNAGGSVSEPVLPAPTRPECVGRSPRAGRVTADLSVAAQTYRRMFRKISSIVSDKASAAI